MKLAGCVIKDDEGKVLLIHRNTAKRTQWEIPGGEIDPGETPEQTAVRELKEELGIVVELVRHIGTKLFEEDGKHHEYHWFEAKIVKGKPHLTEPEEYDDLRHFALDEMHKIRDLISANTKNLVHAARNQEITI
jgi:8-oxo-dGTP diphosphatase